jgi:hypothetical protein
MTIVRVRERARPYTEDKQQVLRDLKKLGQERHSRSENRTREVLAMSEPADVFSLVSEGCGAMLPLARRETPRSTWRVPAADQLIAPPCEVVLPTLEKVPTEQRFSADDREVIALAEILVKTDIAVVEDWEKSGRDATKYLLLTLQRWIRDHGGASIQRRFDLDLTLSDRLVDYSDERGPEGYALPDRRSRERGIRAPEPNH